jgi:ATP-binding cassette, subfamily A (ABC1), member 3
LLLFYAARFLFFGSNQYQDATGKKWASIFPATAFSFGCDIVAGYEYSEQGVQDWNRSQGVYSFDTSLAMLLFDSLFFMVLGWYFDQVMPREYGTPKPVWFLLSPSYWCGNLFCWQNSKSKQSTWDQLPSYSDNKAEDSSADNHECMADPSLVPQIKIRDLTKRYAGRKNKDLPPAVDQLCLDLYESQITTLLGHNGKGRDGVDKRYSFNWKYFSIFPLLPRRFYLLREQGQERQAPFRY